MKIDKIAIKNFRNIEEEKKFSLNPNFTIIIGINGKGKSTILHAIRIAAGTYLLGIPEAGKRHIWENEIRIKDFGTHLSIQTPTYIRAEGSVDGNQLSKFWQRQIPEGKTKTTSNAEDVGEIRDLAQRKYEQITKHGISDIDNPVIAYFGTGRLYGNSRYTAGPYIGREIFKQGYYSWAEMQYATYQYPYWLKGHPFLVKDSKESPELLEAFYEAIKLANPYLKEIGFDGDALRLKVKLNEEEPETDFLPLSLHSDGIIAHTAMVAELAFRCIVLNAHHRKDAIRNSRGIVMIDEIDLHLHPNWQRHVVRDLKAAFPNIQFVATTHSPFIVQSLDSSELVNLDKETDVVPKDLSIEEVSKDIMGIESEMSEENQSDENLSINYLERLNELGPQNRQDVIDELNQIELRISDPGVRAFLKMKRLERNI